MLPVFCDGLTDLLLLPVGTTIIIVTIRAGEQRNATIPTLLWSPGLGCDDGHLKMIAHAVKTIASINSS